jgi:hypothetical protein
VRSNGSHSCSLWQFFDDLLVYNLYGFKRHINLAILIDLTCGHGLPRGVSVKLAVARWEVQLSVTDYLTTSTSKELLTDLRLAS